MSIPSQLGGSPYISIVIVGRNDNYGVNFLERINTFVKHLDRQTSKFNNIFELIIVEWNPLPDKPRLKDVLIRAKNFSTRIITVPENLHKIANMPAPVLEFWAKNVGIRRALGDYILVSNPDIMFSDHLVEELAKKNLQDDVVYRTDRYDYHGDGIQYISLENYIDFAVKNTFRVHMCPESVEVKYCDSIFNLPSSQRNDIIFTNASGDFILSSRKTFEKARGLAWESSLTKGHVDSFSLIRLVKQGKIKSQFIFTRPFCIFHMDHPRKPNLIRWEPEVALAAAEWAGWFAKPSWFNDDWGFRDYNLEEYTIWESK
jgi:hypothetical protein